MSFLFCERCDAPIDSDDDPGCIIDPPACTPLDLVARLTRVLCESCRETEWDRAQERAAEEA